MAIDRRVNRTRTALHQALISLIRERRYDEITVDDILKVADVGRSTFYAHYKSKDELLERGFEQLRSMLLNVADAGAGLDQCRALFEHVAEYRHVQLALAGGRGEVIVETALSATIDQTLRRSLSSPGNSNVPRELIVAHTVGTLNTVLRWWLRPGSETATAAEADRMFRTLLLGGIPHEWQQSLRERFVVTGPT